MTPLRTGFALAITVGLFYALCALVWALAPAPFLGFMNSHVPWHGLQHHGAASAIRMAGIPDGAPRTEHLDLFCRCFLCVVVPSIDTLINSRFGKFSAIAQGGGPYGPHPIF